MEALFIQPASNINQCNISKEDINILYALSRNDTMQRDEVAASNWLKETQKGYIRIATLILLSKKPHHGYEIMKEIRERTRGFWKPTSGGMYPILKNLQNSGYIQGEWDKETKRRKRIYKITESGRAVLNRALSKENQLAETIKTLFEEYMKGVLEVDTQCVSTLNIPRPLAELLKEANEEENVARRLEDQCRQMRDMINKLQMKLGVTEKKLRELRKEAR